MEQDLQCILQFMYNGEVQVPEGRLKDFLKTAETLQVRGLIDKEAATSTTFSKEASRKTFSPVVRFEEIIEE